MVKSDFLMETISTSRFAQRVSCIKQDAKVNEETDPIILIKTLKAEVRNLRDELAHYRKGGAQEDREMSSDEYERCREVVQRFLDDTDPNSNPTGLDGDFARMMACFRIIKEMFLKKCSGGNAVLVSPFPSDSQKGSANFNERDKSSLSCEGQIDMKLKSSLDALTLSLQQKENEISLLFNILEKSTAIKYNAETQTGEQYTANVTHSERSAEPQLNTRGILGFITTRNGCNNVSNTSLEGCQQQQIEGQGLQSMAPSTSLQTVCSPAISAAETRLRTERQEGYDLSILADVDIMKDRQTAFESFRRSYRKYEQIENNKADLKKKYEKCKSVAEEVNSCVDRIKSIKVQVQRLRADRAIQGVDEASQEEVRYMEQLSEAKQEYSEKGTLLAKEKEYIDHLHLIMKRAQEQLSKDFEEWFGLRQKQLELTRQQMTTGAAVGVMGLKDRVTMPTEYDTIAYRTANGRLTDSTRDCGMGETKQQRSSNTSLLVEKGGSVISPSFTPRVSAVSSNGKVLPPILHPAHHSIQQSNNNNISSVESNLPSFITHPSSAPIGGSFNRQQQQSSLRNGGYLSASLSASAHSSIHSPDNVSVSNTIVKSLMNGLPMCNPLDQRQHSLHSTVSKYTNTIPAVPFQSTGDPVADQQLLEMHKAREEMRARRAQVQQLK